MLYAFIGGDRERARAALEKAAQAAAKESGARRMRVTDAHALADLEAALRGGGMFGERRVVVLEDVFQHEEMGSVTFSSLEAMSRSREPFFIYEEALNAGQKRRIKELAHAYEEFAPREEKKERKTIFQLAHALKMRDRKALWVGLERELAAAAPEAIHGVLFWGAKQMLLAAREGTAQYDRAVALVSALAELPHRARRDGIPLEYALLRFALSVR